MNKGYFIISSHAPIRQALTMLNEVHSQSMTLFVVDDDERMVGTLTDGDIRRALIAGEDVDNEVRKAMHRSFSYLTGLDEVAKLKTLRDRNIFLVPVLDNDMRVVDIIDLKARKSALPVDAVLMAGGKGERLRPLTLTIPKPLLKIGDKAIIDRNIDALIDYGVRNVSVTVNYLKEQLIDHYAEPRANGVKVNCVEEDQFFGTIGSLRLIKEFDNDTILVMNSDLLTDIDYEDFFLHFQENDAMMSAAAIPYTISIPYGIFQLEGHDIKGVSEKPVYNLYANAGIYLLKREALKYIPDNQVFNATDLIDVLALQGEKVIRYPLSGLWIDIGNPQEFAKAQDLVRHLR
jgi:nucleotidyltransferase